MIGINNFQQKVHETAVEKGWWNEGERNYGEICALFHSEISESYMEFYEENIEVYYKDSNPKKPEGALIELSDFGIRVLDYTGFYNIDTEHLMAFKIFVFCSTPFELCNTVHSLISESFEAYRRHETIIDYIKPIVCALNTIQEFIVREYGVSLLDLMTLKSLYNNTREYRHGNKKA
jgi:hypothetical protein